MSSKVQQQCPGSLEKVSCQAHHRWSLTDGGYFACPRPSSDISHVLPCPPTQHLSSFTIPWASRQLHCIVAKKLAFLPLLLSAACAALSTLHVLPFTKFFCRYAI